MAEDSKTVASKIGAEIRRLPGQSVPEVRVVRRAWSSRLRTSNGEFVLAVARELHRTDEHSWVALELIRYHEAAFTLISDEHLEEFARGLCSWGTVDAFAVSLAGPAWMRGQVSDELIRSWALSGDRWRRRAALASTVVLNTPSRGGRGDAARTLAVCELLVDDRDDMVVKAMSWALRRLAMCDEGAVRSFMATYEKRLAARVRREVRYKLATGRKNPGPGSR